MADTFEGLEVFVTAVRSRSFTAAAERLGVSKSAVVKSVAGLRGPLGYGVVLQNDTQAEPDCRWRCLYQACSQALEEVANAEGALASTGAAPTVRLRIDTPAAFGRRILLPVLLDIARPHPAFQLALSFGDRVIDPFSEAVDLVVRFGEPADQAGLVMRKLTEQRLCICASPAYLATQGTPQSLKELNQHHCIVNFRRERPLYWRVIDGIPGLITPPATHEAGDGDAIIGLALAGFGLCQMPISLVSRYLEAGTLVSVLDAHAQVMVPVNLLWPKSRHLVPRVRYIVDELIKSAARGTLDKDGLLQSS